MALIDALQALENTDIAIWVKSSLYAFPGLDAVHIIASTLVFGSVAMLDLRLLGLSARNQAVTKISDEVLPWTWISFLIAVVSGTLLFSGQAASYYVNREFRIKMILLPLAGVNLLIFHFFTWSKVRRWDRATPPLSAKLAAILSLILWAGIIIAGRWVGWTLNLPF